MKTKGSKEKAGLTWGGLHNTRQYYIDDGVSCRVYCIRGQVVPFDPLLATLTLMPDEDGMCEIPPR